MRGDTKRDYIMNKEDGAERKDLLTTSLVLTLFITAFTVSAAGQLPNPTDENNLNVDVNISKKTIIDIQPSSFSWGQGAGVDVGAVAGPENESNKYGRIQIENLGSENISKVWFNTSVPSQRPFGTGNSGAYDPGNFIALDSNDSTVTDFNQFVNRREFGIDKPGNSKDIIYLDTPADWDFGRFRTAGKEYFWTLDEGAGSVTDLTGNTFRIGINHHDQTQQGTTALDGPCSGGDGSTGSNQCNEYTLSTTTPDSTTWAFTDVEVGALDDDGTSGREYCAVMNESEVTSNNRPSIYFIKWNKGFPGTDQGDCAQVTNYTVGGSSGTDALVPGDWITRNIRARIPFGVVSDQLNTGSMYVLATS